MTALAGGATDSSTAANIASSEVMDGPRHSRSASDSAGYRLEAAGVAVGSCPGGVVVSVGSAGGRVAGDVRVGVGLGVFVGGGGTGGVAARMGPAVQARVGGTVGMLAMALAVTVGFVVGAGAVGAGCGSCWQAAARAAEMVMAMTMRLVSSPAGVGVFPLWRGDRAGRGREPQQ